MSTLTKLAIVGVLGLVLAVAVALVTSQQQKLGEAGFPASRTTSTG